MRAYHLCQLGQDTLVLPFSNPSVPAAFDQTLQGSISTSPVPGFVKVVSRRLVIIWLMVSFNASTSPFASTRMVRVRSPFVTADATSEIERTCVVKVLRQLVYVFGKVLPDT